MSDKALSSLTQGTPDTGDFFYGVPGANSRKIQLGTLPNSAQSAFPGTIDLTEISEPSSPAANVARLFARDVSTRTELAFKRSDGTVVDLLRGIVTVEDFGAVGNGSTDDLTAFTNALASGAAVIYALGKNYRLSAGITIPGGVKLISDGFIPGNPAAGTRLTFDLATATCVTLNGDGNDTCAFRGFTVSRAAGSIPAGSIGVFVDEGYQINLDDIQSERHAIAYKWFCDGTEGIASHCARLYSRHITEYHLDIDSWPELYMTQCRFGANGAGDVNCTGYMRITGGATGGGGQGPNTLLFNKCQFNSPGLPDVWLDFTAITGEGGNAVEYKFTNCHIEGLTVAGIRSAADVSAIDRFTMVGCTFNNPSIPFFSLNAATQPSQWQIVGNNIFSSTFNLAPTNGLSKCSIADNVIGGTTSITGAAGSQLSMVGNTMNGNTTLAGSTWGHLLFAGTLAAGSLTVTATGNVRILSDTLNQFSNALLAPGGAVGTPGFAFSGDANTGMFSSVADVIEWTGGGVRGMFMDGTNLTVERALRSAHATLPLGYGTGAGGTVTQITSKATAVTLNKPTGLITMNNAALAAGATVSFNVNNTSFVAGDTVLANHASAGTAGAYRVAVRSGVTNIFVLDVTNTTGGSLSEAAVIAFTVIKGQST